MAFEPLLQAVADELAARAAMPFKGAAALGDRNGNSNGNGDYARPVSTKSSGEALHSSLIQTGDAAMSARSRREFPNFFPRSPQRPYP